MKYKTLFSAAVVLAASLLSNAYASSCNDGACEFARTVGEFEGLVAKPTYYGLTGRKKLKLPNDITSTAGQDVKSNRSYLKSTMCYLVKDINPSYAPYSMMETEYERGLQDADLFKTELLDGGYTREEFESNVLARIKELREEIKNYVATHRTSTSVNFGSKECIKAFDAADLHIEEIASKMAANSTNDDVETTDEL